MADSDAARSTGALTPDEIVNRPFPTAFRGLAETEVRGWLARVAEYVATLRSREREFDDRIAALQHQLASPPPVTEQQLVAALGDETTKVLRSAKEAAADIARKAEERAIRIVREAQDDAKRIRDEAERLLGARSLEAEEAGATIVRDAQARAADVRAEATAELAGAREKALRAASDELVVAREQAKQVVDEAHALRDKLIGDLGKRRTLLLAQIEQLRAGRERLLDAYRTVKRTLDEATQALQHVETRAAAEFAAGAGRDDDIDHTEADAPAAPRSSLPVEGRPTPPARPPMRAAPLPPRPVTGSEGPAVRVLGPRPPDPSTVAPGPTAPPALTPAPPLAAPAPAPTAPVEPAPAEMAAVEPAPAEVAAAPPPPTPVAPEPEIVTRTTHDDIEAIFARIRAARDEALAEYSDAAAPEGAQPQPARLADATPAEPAAPSEPEPAPLAAVPPPEPVPEAVDPSPEAGSEPPSARTAEFLERRDVTLEPMAASLTKRVKRALQDEQNNALDALRQHRGDLTADAVLKSVHEHVASYVVVLVDMLGEAYGAGVRSVGGDTDSVTGSELGALIERVARSVATPLRERVASGISESTRLGEDETAVAERLNARYREWKTQRVDTVVRDGLTAAFALGTYDGTAPGEVMRWVVDDDGPCSDCHDNALEATPRGMPFPTGHIHPPAHPGCRCLIVKESVVAVTAPAKQHD